MTENRKDTEQPDVEAHRVKYIRDTEEAQDVEAHGFSARGRHEDTPPAKPGTEGRDDDVEDHGMRPGR